METNLIPKNLTYNIFENYLNKKIDYDRIDTI